MRESNFSKTLDMAMKDKMEQENLVGAKSRGGDANELPFRRFDKELPTLFREDEGNAGFDLFARLQEDLVIQPGEVVMIPLNLAIKMPAFVVGLLFQRSSTYNKWGIKLTNSVGVIDSTYSGNKDEWCGQFKNETDAPVTVRRGDKICQAVFLPLFQFTPVEVDTMESVDRGGFGTSADNADSINK